MSAIGALARHCCLKPAEDTDSRDYASESVAKLLFMLPENAKQTFTTFLCKLCRHPQVIVFILYESIFSKY